MSLPTPQHVVVIGAGIIGVNCALALQSRGFRVTIVDERPPGTATSAGNAGCFAISAVAPISMPGLIATAILATIAAGVATEQGLPQDDAALPKKE